MAKRPEDRFLDYLEGRLSNREADALEAALAADEDLQRSFNAYRRLLDTEQDLRDLQPELAARFDVKVMEAIAAADSRLWSRLAAAWREHQRVVIASAASLATAVIVLVVAIDVPPPSGSVRSAEPLAVRTELGSEEGGTSGDAAQSSNAAAPAEAKRDAAPAIAPPAAAPLRQQNVTAAAKVQDRPLLIRKPAAPLADAPARPSSFGVAADQEERLRRKETSRPQMLESQASVGAAPRGDGASDGVRKPADRSSAAKTITLQIPADEFATWLTRGARAAVVAVYQMNNGRSVQRIICDNAEVLYVDPARGEVRVRVSGKEAAQIEAARQQGKVALSPKRVNP